MPNVFSRLGQCAAALAVVVTLSGFAALESLFAPKPELWERWTASDERSTTTVDHGPWNTFLKTYVKTDATGLNRVAYGRVSDADKKALHAYLGSLKSVAVSRLSRAEQQAYWINLYNALTVRLILDFHPVKSIQDIDLSSGFFSSGPWGKELIKIEGELVSLNDIEHRILRPIWKDPRIHYAVNCASVGCPNLQDEAFTAKDMSAMLDRAAAAYVNSPRGVKVGDGGLVVSKIYSWFKDDFGGTDDAVLKHLEQYASNDLVTHIVQSTGISGYDYDWSLNGSN